MPSLFTERHPICPFMLQLRCPSRPPQGLKGLKDSALPVPFFPVNCQKRKSKSFAKIRLLSLNALYTVRFACAFQANAFSVPFSVHEAATEAHVLNRAGYPSRLKTEQAMT